MFFISLAVYPAVTVLVESQYKGKGHAWNGEFESKFQYVLSVLEHNEFMKCNLKKNNDSRHILCTCGYVSYLQYGRLRWKGIIRYFSMGENLHF